MGNYNLGAVGKNQGAVFRQSLYDFPCPVALGKNTPSFGLYRFNKALRFVPPDDEGFTLQGDKRRLLYRGRRRSHRFTILGDTAFEYDCILEKPPDSNTISLFMLGAEDYDFFRQPDFLKNPLLAGSYAVYKKETLLGEGTGKLCHIHRPEIIDARGWRCWGDLAVVGNMLRITIPEWFLSVAVYPVVVDPTIGTSTVGSQYLIEYDPPEEPYKDLILECEMAANRFFVPETINGLCTAYIYTNEDYTEEAGGRAVVFSENNNKPYTKLSTEEGFINFEISGSNPKGWRSGTFRSNGSIANGSYIWFGVAAQFFWFPRFDYGMRSVSGDWNPWGELPATFPGRTWENNFKLSMYFNYTSAQNYVRTIIQGVALTDSRKLKADYKRNLTQTAGVNSLLNRYKTFFIKLGETVKGLDNDFSSVLFVRSIKETIKTADILRHIAAYFRGLSDNAEIESGVKGGWFLVAKISDTVHATGSVFRSLILLVRIVTKVFIRDYLLERFLKAREELILKSAICREIVLDSRID